MTDMHPLDPTEAFAQIGRINLGETDLDHVLRTVATLAQRTVPGAAEVSVTLVRDRGACTAAFTGDVALALDETQYDQGNGPCLDASAGASTLSVPDMAEERRWPDFARRAAGAGVFSSLAIGLPLQESVSGALNIYATKAQAFDEDAVALAQAFAAYAGVALANAHLYDTQAALARHMQTAMESRAVIEQAKGIIMGGRRCTADEAFGILRRMSQDSNRKLRDVAQTVVARASSGPAG
jgi:GAF domain-containing protein